MDASTATLPVIEAPWPPPSSCLARLLRDQPSHPASTPGVWRGSPIGPVTYDLGPVDVRLCYTTYDFGLRKKFGLTKESGFHPIILVLSISSQHLLQLSTTGSVREGRRHVRRSTARRNKLTRNRRQGMCMMRSARRATQFARMGWRCGIKIQCIKSAKRRCTDAQFLSVIRPPPCNFPPSRTAQSSPSNGQAH
uniref:Uncharacterized protein n=1 Tax=Oryza glumipatula TaxID=40148 RepID=A0A0D9ZPV4_9ORYZ